MTEKEKQEISENVTEYVKKAMCLSDLDFETDDFNVKLIGALYCRLGIVSLEKCRMTPAIAAKIAELYMMFQKDKLASLLILNRRYRLKKIINFAYCYRAEFPNFVKEIGSCCRNEKSNKCILIYNYDYILSTHKELEDIDTLHRELASVGITLVDAVRFTKGKTTVLISPLNNSGYKMPK